MRIERIEEFLIDTQKSASIMQLIQECFPDYPTNQTYFKQVPDFRFLAWEKQALIAHAAIDYRIIKVGEVLFRVFLIGDICVSLSHQYRRIASKIIAEGETLAKNNQVDFIIVAVSNPSLYLKNGFSLVNNDCRWVIIHKHSTLGVRHRNIANSLMVKQLGNTSWNDGLLDFLGHIV